jgi:hypothetical protein
MRRYSYFFLRGGRIVHSETRRFPKDEHAVRLAKLLTGYSNTEVWEEDRLVARLLIDSDGANQAWIAHDRS